MAVTEIKPQSDFILLLTFENGEKRSFDMKPYLEKGIFQELKNEHLYRTVRVAFDTIEWENEADFDPETLYQESQLVTDGNYQSMLVS
jgi:hypothetical protein